MSDDTYAKMLLASDLSPMELVYYPVRSTGRREPAGLIGVVKVNSMDLGVLYPAQYRVVSNRNALGARLAAWAFGQLMEEMADMDLHRLLPDWISLYIPSKMLLSGQLEKLLDHAAPKQKDYRKHLVLECSSELLLESSGQVAATMEALRQRFGVRFMISGFGDAFCPVMRLSELPAEFVALDPRFSSENALQEPGLISLAHMINGLEKKAVLVKGEEGPLVEQAFERGIAFYASALEKSLSEVLDHG